MGDKCPTVCFFPLSNNIILVYHREMCPPYSALFGRPSSQHHQPAVPGRPGVIPACSMQPASRPEASWPSAFPARSIHVTPHRIARLEWLYPRLFSSRQLL